MGMYIRVKTFPSSKEESVIRKGPDSFEIRVKEDPIDGKATERVMEIIADYFDINRNMIRIVKGGKERSKIFLLPDTIDKKY